MHRLENQTSTANAPIATIINLGNLPKKGKSPILAILTTSGPGSHIWSVTIDGKVLVATNTIGGRALSAFLFRREGDSPGISADGNVSANAYVSTTAPTFAAAAGIIIPMEASKLNIDIGAAGVGITATLLVYTGEDR